MQLNKFHTDNFNFDLHCHGSHKRCIHFTFQAIGSKNEKRTESLIATSFCVAVVFSVGVTVILEILLPAILKALNTPAETYDMAYSYLSIYVLGYLAIYLYCYFAAVLRSLELYVSGHCHAGDNHIKRGS